MKFLYYRLRCLIFSLALVAVCIPWWTLIVCGTGKLFGYHLSYLETAEKITIAYLVAMILLFFVNSAMNCLYALQASRKFGVPFSTIFQAAIENDTSPYNLRDDRWESKLKSLHGESFLDGRNSV